MSVTLPSLPTQPPTVTASFNPTTITTAATSTLTLTVSNPNSGTALSGVAVAAGILPAGLSGSAVSTTCNSGTATYNSGSRSLSLAGASLAASASCSVTLTITPSSATTYNFTPGQGSSTSPATSGGTATGASLTVNPPAPSFSSNALTYGTTVAYNAGSASATSIDVATLGSVTNSPTAYYLGASGTSTSGTSTHSGSVSVNSSGVISYTPPVGYRGSDSFQIRAHNVTGESATTTVTVTVGDPTLGIAVLGSGAKQGSSLTNYSISVSGGKSPYSCDTTLASGTLPGGVSLASDCSLSGVPTASGTFSFTANATDSSTGTGPFTKTSGTLLLSVAPPAPSVSASFSPTTIPADGGTEASLLITLTNSSNATLTGLSLASSVLPANLLGTGASISTTCNGIATYDGTTKIFNLGGGLLNSNSSCTITLPVYTYVAGNYSVTTGVVSSSQSGDGGTATTPTALTAFATPTATSWGGIQPAYNAGSGTATAYDFTTHVTNATFVRPATLPSHGTLDVATGNNAAGLVLNYTPDVGFHGPDSFTYYAVASNGTTLSPSAETVSITVANPVFTTTLIGSGATYGSPLSYSVSNTGGFGPYSCALQTGALPPGVTLQSNCLIDGSPTATGDFSFTVMVQDSSTGTGPQPQISGTLILSVASADNVITFNAPTDVPLTAGTTSVSASASSGLTVAFASTTAATCTVSGTTVTLLALGQCSIQATQPGDGNHSAATPVTRSFAVIDRSNVISFAQPADTALDAGPVTLSATASSGLAVTFSTSTSAVCDVTGNSATLKTVGVCTIDAHQAGDTGHDAATTVTRSFNVTQGTQTISFTAPSDTALDAGPLTLAATASSGLTVSFSAITTATCTVSGTTLTLVSVGLCTVEANQAGDATRAAAAPVQRSFNITQAGNVISFTALPDVALSTGTVGLSASASSGLAIAFASATPATCTVNGSTATLLAVGTCTISADQPGNASYVAAIQAVQSFAIVKNANLISFPQPKDVTLDTHSVTLAATASSGLAVTLTSLTGGVCTVSGNDATLLAAGTCTIRANQAGDADYAAALPVTRSFAITQSSVAPTIAAISDFNAAWDDVMLSQTPDIQRQIDRLNGSAPPSDVVDSVLGLMPLVTGSGETSLSLNAIRQAAGDTAPNPLDIWISGTFGLYRTDKNAGQFKLANVGIDYLMSHDVLIGLSGTYDDLGQSETSGSGSASGQGWLAGPYLTARLGDDLYLSLSAKAGRSTNRVSPLGTYEDVYGATRYTLDASLTGRWGLGALTVAPELTLAYVEQLSDAYTNSFGASIPTVETGRGKIGLAPDLSYAFDVGDGSRITTTLKLEGGFKLANDNGTVSWDGLYDGIDASIALSLGGGAHISASAAATGLVTGGTQTVSGKLTLGATLH